MCGRYALHANPDVHGASQCRWGSGNRIANARGESMAERAAFRDAFRQWRCLVPASGFYEWQAIAGQKHPWYLRPRRTR